MRIRTQLSERDRAALAGLLADTPEFTDDEVATALELVDDARSNPTSTYRFLLADDDDDALLGYLCYGATPMTRATVDLYWLVTHVGARRRGVGRGLIDALLAEGARDTWTVRVETSTRAAYAPTIAFYRELGFVEAGRILDFYDRGDDLLTLVWRIQ